MKIKRLAHRIIAILYLGALLVCLLIIAKPGASIFYYKRTLDNQDIQPDTGYAYRYAINPIPGIFRTKDILLFENGRLLTKSVGSAVVSEGQSTYSIEQPSRRLAYIYFASSDNSDPRTNGHIYRLYIPLSIFTRSMGILYLVILMPGLVGFVYFALVIPGNQQAPIHSPGNITPILDQYISYLSHVVKPNGDPIIKRIKTNALNWKQLFTLTVLAAYFYIFMEWIFFVTMPSFLTAIGLWDKLRVFAITSFLFTLICLLFVVLIIALDIILTIAHWSGFTKWLMGLVPAIILSTLTLLLIDNFTYTVFKFGISTSTGIFRLGYTVLFTFIFVYIYLRIQRQFRIAVNKETSPRPSKRLFYIVGCLLFISFGITLASLDFNNLALHKNIADHQQDVRQPNIILIGSDGVNAENMSVYGYERDTTPRMRELAQGSLVAENAFCNASNTGGSVISIFTSELPTETRVLYAPDILTGKDAYQHLPGLLKSAGYKTVEYGVTNYLDAFSFNVLYGFDWVNGVSHTYSPMDTFLNSLGLDYDSYFLHKLTERAFERLQHIYFIKDMENPYLTVTQSTGGSHDLEKINQMLDIIEGTQEPVFAHVHLMGTHTGVLNPYIHLYSINEQLDGNTITDFYDDAVLSFDYYIGMVIDRLKAEGEYDHTILIIYSDHASGFRSNARIPLLIHFPDNSYAGIISQNVQNLDIAPTILDYLGIPKPLWMEGASLLRGNLADHRLIFSAGTDKVIKNANGVVSLDQQQIEPPFYQFSSITVIDCQRWFQMSLKNYLVDSGDVSRYVNPCDDRSVLNEDQARDAIAKQLAANGFDISSLP